MQNLVLMENVAGVGNKIVLNNGGTYGIFGFVMPRTDSDTVEAEIKSHIDTGALNYMFGTQEAGDTQLVAVVLIPSSTSGLSSELQAEAGGKCQQLFQQLLHPTAIPSQIPPQPAPPAGSASSIPAVQAPPTIQPGDMIRHKIAECQAAGMRPSPADLFMSARNAYTNYYKDYLEARYGKPINMLGKKDFVGAQVAPWEYQLTDMAPFMQAFEAQAPQQQTITPQAPSTVPAFLQPPAPVTAPVAAPVATPVAQVPAAQVPVQAQPQAPVQAPWLPAQPAAQPQAVAAAPAPQPTAQVPETQQPPAAEPPKRTRKKKETPATPPPAAVDTAGLQTGTPVPAPAAPVQPAVPPKYRWVIKIKSDKSERVLSGSDTLYDTLESAQAECLQKCEALKAMLPDINPIPAFEEVQIVTSTAVYVPISPVPGLEKISFSGDGASIGKGLVQELLKRPISMFGNPQIAWGTAVHKKEALAELAKAFPDEVFVKKLAALLFP